MKTAWISVRLSDIRSVIKLGGPELIHFLQGLVTKNVEVIKSQNCLPQYASLLNAKGRFMYDMIIHPQYEKFQQIANDNLQEGEAVQSVLIDVESRVKREF
eukprot:TRINITY_DN40129_c0_g1_i1.p2 TRINITY_DN40129_c0_g1~~TRINITY_DN40129_c0_g1_i1.p2  ORF type:complete len:108 (+),score=7.46 TRINITY_DN40129_c0_g1_i1:22-324(+)